jgi:hypothetical protein
MMIRARTVAAFALLVSLVAAAPALGAPPGSGNHAPVAGVPSPIERDFVGLAISGPRSYCEVGDGSDGSGAQGLLCVDVVSVRCRLWRRAAGAWQPAGAIRNDDPRVFFAAPYAGGYHWILSPSFGSRAVPTRCLARWAPAA